MTVQPTGRRTTTPSPGCRTHALVGSYARGSWLLGSQPLPGGCSDVGSGDVGGVPVETGTGAYLMVVRGSAWDSASCTARSGIPASRAAVMNACRGVRRPKVLVILAASYPADNPRHHAGPAAVPLVRGRSVLGSAHPWPDRSPGRMRLVAQADGGHEQPGNEAAVPLWQRTAE
jgi:hypothetical protein